MSPRDNVRLRRFAQAAATEGRTTIVNNLSHVAAGSMTSLDRDYIVIAIYDAWFKGYEERMCDERMGNQK